MEKSNTLDQASIIIPLDDQETRLRRHLPLLSCPASVWFVLVAALFSATCLLMALQNAAQVAELTERLNRLEERASDFDGDTLSERVHHSETEYLMGYPIAQTTFQFRHRQKREAKEKKKEKKKEKPSSVEKAKIPSAIHLNLIIEDEKMRLLRREEVVTLGYGNLTLQGFRPKKEHHDDGDQSFAYKPWKIANWSLPIRDYSFDQREGKVKIERKGLYYIYSQILYHNSAARSSYVIMVDKEMYVKCMGSVDAIMSGSHSSDNARYKTCYVGAARVLNKGQHVWINDLYGHYVFPDANANFFGLIKIVDLDK